jgi:DNA-binding XRE family transcriptional regulator
MPRVVKETQKQRAERAKRWRDFRKRNLMPQTVLAELLDASRKMVQNVEGAKVTPIYSIQSRFAALEKKYGQGA